jgi:hypothetical protein
MTGAIELLVGTRKGAWIYRSDAGRTAWNVTGPLFLGQIVNHFVRDPRDGKTLLMAASTGHLGPTILRSTDGGTTWTEAKQPPAFAKGEPHGRSVDHSFWLEPGHASEPGVWWAGTSPPALFRSVDGGQTWASVDGLNQHPQVMDWFPPEGGTPDGAILNQVILDPRDARHMYVATCSAGVLETTDQGETWRPLNRNVRCDFLPDPYPEFGQDSHYVALAPTDPDRLWQQNHCGIYRLDRPDERWERIGEAMPADVGDIGTATPPGSGRWTARRSGRAPVPEGGPRPTARATPARPGRGRTRVSPSNRAGSPSSGRPSAATRTIRWASTSARPAARSG